MNKVLVISNSGDLHTDLLIEACQRQSVECFRYNTDHFRLNGAITWNIKNQGKIALGPHQCDLSDVGLLIYRRPKPIFNQRNDVDKWLGWLYDQEWSSIEISISELVKCPIVNPAGASYYGQHKLVQLQLAQKYGVACPETIISNSPLELGAFSDKYSCVSKAIYDCSTTHNGTVHTGKTVSVSENDIQSYDPKFCPMLLQEKIDAAAMWRIVVVGDSVFGFRLHGNELMQETDSRLIELKLSGEAREVPETIQRGLISICKSLGLIYSSSDFIEDHEGRLWFIDLNPEGQWGAYEKRFGTKISDEIINLMVAH